MWQLTSEHMALHLRDDEVGERAQLVACPVCAHQVPTLSINHHLDSGCLQLQPTTWPGVASLAAAGIAPPPVPQPMAPAPAQLTVPAAAPVAVAVAVPFGGRDRDMMSRSAGAAATATATATATWDVNCKRSSSERRGEQPAGNTGHARSDATTAGTTLLSSSGTLAHPGRSAAGSSALTIAAAAQAAGAAARCRAAPLPSRRPASKRRRWRKLSLERPLLPTVTGLQPASYCDGHVRARCH